MYLLLIAFAPAAGVMLTQLLPSIAVAALGIALFVRRRAFVVALLFALGALRGLSLADDWQMVRRIADQRGTIVGSVQAVADGTGERFLRIAVHQVGDTSVRAGQVSLSVYTDQAVARGERVTIGCPQWAVRERAGALVRSSPQLRCADPRVITRQPPGTILAVLERGRRGFIAALQRSLPEPSASLAIGLTLGETETFPPEVVEAFRVSGTSHVLALSGYNVTVLVAVLLALLPILIGRRPAFLTTVIALLAFLALTGVPPSLLRATVMGGLLIAARWIGRRASAGRLLAITVVVLVFVEPALIADLGFALSVVATWGLVGGADRLAPRRFPALARTLIGSSTAAFLFTLPVLLSLFGRLSIVAPLANVAVLPLVPVLFFASAGLGMLGVVAPPLAPSLGAPVDLLSRLFIGAVRWFADLPFASVDLSVPNPLPLVLPALFLVAVFLWHERPCPLCQCPTPSFSGSI